MNKINEFSPQEQRIIFSLARMALGDAETFDAYADELKDVIKNSDSFLKTLQGKLETI